MKKEWRHPRRVRVRRQLESPRGKREGREKEKESLFDQTVVVWIEERASELERGKEKMVILYYYYYRESCIVVLHRRKLFV